MNKEKLVEEHSRLVYKIALDYNNRNNLEDLYQVGMIGLFKASEKYNPEYNTKFSTYAYDYIRGEILAYLKKDTTIKINPEYFRIRKEYERILAAISQSLNREATLTEVSLYLEIEESTLEKIISLTDYVLSLDQSYEESDMYDFVGVNTIEEVDNKILLDEIISSLDTKEQQIIDYRYFKGYTQDETARALNMTQIQVCRTEKKSILKLQKKAI